MSLASFINNRVIGGYFESDQTEHRQEFVATIHNITYINDSKATNVNSVWYTMELMDRPLVWICGGVDKGNDYSMIEPLVKMKATAIIRLGVDNEKIKLAFAHLHHIKSCSANSMREAVLWAHYIAKRDDVVLLSPACASFDLFSSYEDRGRQFKREVMAL